MRSRATTWPQEKSINKQTQQHVTVLLWESPKASVATTALLFYCVKALAYPLPTETALIDKGEEMWVGTR